MAGENINRFLAAKEYDEADWRRTFGATGAVG